MVLVGNELLLVSILLLTLIAFHKKKYRWQIVPGILFQIVFISFGYLVSQLNDDRKSDYYFERINGANGFVVEIQQKPTLTKSGRRALAKINYVHRDGIWIGACGKIYLYLNDDSLTENLQAAKLQAGDQIFFSKVPEAIKAPLNPGQYDFKTRSALKNIYCQIRLSTDQWQVCRSPDNFHLLRFAESLRDHLLQTYRKAGITGNEYAVLSALVLGYDDEIDRETMAAFSASGTLHVLSVSGMHVGLVFTLLSFLLKRMEGKRYWWLARLFIIVIILWFYALLTGLSPSVIRSAMMFSFILIGKSIRRDSNIYNTLAASIVVISICFGPMLIFDVGFQLSYLAVAGISFFYPYIFEWFYFEQKLTGMIWQLTAVSLAAQLATLPVSIYYFHQFPNYFILANLLIIPVSTIAIFAGIFLLAFKPFPWLLLKAGWLTSKLVFIQNFLAIEISKLPFAVSDELFLTGIEMFLLYGVILSLTYYLVQKSFRSLRSAMCFVGVFLSALIFRSLIQVDEKQIVFYSDPIKPCFEVSWSRKSILFYTDSLKSLILSNQRLTQQKCFRKDRQMVHLGNFSAYNSKYISVNSSVVFSGMLIRWETDTLRKKYSYEIFWQDTSQARCIRLSNRFSRGEIRNYNLKNGAIVFDL